MDGSDENLLVQESPIGSLGGLQIIPLSGPELLDYEPPEYSEPAPVLDPITTIPLLQTFSSTSILADRVKDIWLFFQRLDARYPSAGITNLTLSRWRSTPPTSVSGLYNGTVPKLRFSDGTVVDSADDPYHCSDVPGFKVPSQLGTATPLVDAYIDGTFYLFAKAQSDPSSDWRKAREELDAAATHKSVITGGDNAGDTYWFFEFDLDVVLFDGVYSDHVFTLPAGSLTTYDYEEPPADYAQNLRDAQSWLPYTGSISFQAQFAALARLSGQTVNISGALPRWATMGALVAGEDLDLDTGLHTVFLGLPERFSGVTSATRIDTRPNDNIFAI